MPSGGIQQEGRASNTSFRLREIADVALYEASKPGTQVYFPVFFVAVLGLGHHREHPLALALFGLAWLLAGVLRWWVPRQALRHYTEGPDLWRERFRRSLLLTPISWGLFTLTNIVWTGVGWQALMCMFVAGGISSGATAAFNLDQRLHRGYVLTLWVPILLGLAFSSGDFQGGRYLLATAVFFTLYLLKLGREQGGRYWQGLRDRLFVSQMAEFTASLVPLVQQEALPQRLQQALTPLLTFERAWAEPGARPADDRDTLSTVLGSTPEVQLTFHLQRAGGFTSPERKLLEAFAAPASTALDRSALFQKVQRMARYDGLTGAANRAHFFESAQEVLGVSRRLDSKSGQVTHHSVILLDIDHFKSVNDRFGHDVGDEVLRQVAACCRRSLREVDVFARYGGEEFVVFLPGANLTEAAERTAERLRRAVGADTIAVPDGELRVTVSLGVAQIDDDGLEASLKRADQALYEAKRSGRDRVVPAT